MAVLLGTVALEPNRWGTLDPSGAPSTRLSEWLDEIAAAGFDGIELWDRHLTAVPNDEVDAIVDHPLPVTVFNSYVDLDDADPTERVREAHWVDRARSEAVKFNVGARPELAAAYAERVARWVDVMPAGVRLLCECHEGTIAEDPRVAAELLDRAGPPERVQAIVHTHEPVEGLRQRFDAYGERISHVHVNFLDGSLHAPALHDVRGRLGATVDLLRAAGFDGSWTVEFVQGVLTDDDRPELLVRRAAEDLRVLREVVG